MDYFRNINYPYATDDDSFIARGLQLNMTVDEINNIIDGLAEAITTTTLTVTGAVTFSGLNIDNTEDTLLGFTTNASTRPKILNDGKEAINNHLPIIYDRHTIEEMYSFVEKKKNNKYKVEAENGAHDDLIMSFFIVYYLWQTEERPLNDAETQSLIDQLPEEVI